LQNAHFRTPNLDVLSKFVEPDATSEKKWWKDLEAVFAGRAGDEEKAEG